MPHKKTFLPMMANNAKIGIICQLFANLLIRLLM